MGKPRKKYRPKAVNPLAHMTAILGSRFLSKDDLLQMSLKPSLALDAITVGNDTTEDWRCLFECNNLFEQLIKKGHAQDPQDMVGDTQQAIVSILERRKTGNKALYAGELKALRDFCANYSMVIETLTNQELFVAFDAMLKNLERVIHTRDPEVTYVTPPKE